MLSLIGVEKEYRTGGQSVKALDGVSISFRKNEFVSILGPSGCGKTTLLNLIGGLDHATAGDLVIRGKSTKDFSEKDWDAYRNHTIGFVFQSYNLIPHQTVLANVELALTLTGVSRTERRARAEEALKRVGLGDQLHKKPSQMSGGQMQRVAIARALINNPDVLLADEPTGALDSETSVQVMELLKEIARDRLVIMVTHNPELAQAYSTRVIRLLDGRVVDDTLPAEPETEAPAPQGKVKKPGMSFFTALSLSLNNLLTKKTRTILVAFAGSIGIIGIALILSLSHGFRSYISRVEEETLSGYPLTITSEAMDSSALLESMSGQHADDGAREEGYIHSGEIMTDMFAAMMNGVEKNDLAAFKAQIDGDADFRALTSDVSYQYDADLQIWSTDGEKPLQVNPSKVFESMMGMSMSGDMNAYMSSMNSMSTAFGGRSMNAWTELIDNRALLDQQYDVIAGRWPESKEELVLVVNEDNSLSEMTLYTLGLKPQSELSYFFASFVRGQSFELKKERYSYEQLLNLTYQLVLPAAYYEKNPETGLYEDIRSDAAKLQAALENGLTLRVVGIVRPSEDSVARGMNGGSIGYLKSLTDAYITSARESEIVRAQMENPETDVFTGLPLAKEATASIGTTSAKSIQSAKAAQTAQTTYAENLKTLGAADLSVPSSIVIYPKNFEAKKAITNYIDEYNARMEAEGHEERVLRYTDYIGVLLSGVTTIIDAITYVLIAFVAISLVVSSIMIGVITYISVLERTKEIGILRAIGASKRDISRVFNAETLIVGFLAGAMGIGISCLLILPANAIIQNLTGIANMAKLPVDGAVALVAISMLLTLIAGLIPSRFAARRDPVEALRSE